MSLRSSPLSWAPSIRSIRSQSLANSSLLPLWRWLLMYWLAPFSIIRSESQLTTSSLRRSQKSQKIFITFVYRLNLLFLANSTRGSCFTLLTNTQVASAVTGYDVSVYILGARLHWMGIRHLLATFGLAAKYLSQVWHLWLLDYFKDWRKKTHDSQNIVLFQSVENS